MPRPRASAASSPSWKARAQNGALTLALAEMQPVIARAVADAEAQGVAGKAVTPFLLGRIFELTGGRSLDANIALVLNNARLAAAIAVAASQGEGMPAIVRDTAGS